MERKRLYRIGLATLLSAIVAAPIVALDLSRARMHQQRDAEALARQVSQQAESLSFVARSHAESDPLKRAVEWLMQTNEKVLKIEAVSLSAGPPEFVSRSADALEYSRMILPEKSEGVRVSVPLGFVGVFGTTTRFASDGVIAGLFFLFFFLIYPSMRKLWTDELPVDVTSLKTVVFAWTKEAKALLVQLGGHIKETLRSAQALAAASGKSRDSIAEVRTKLKSELERLRDTRKLLKGCSPVADQAEVLSLNLVLEASRLGDPGRRLSQMAEELHRIIHDIKTTTRDAELGANQLELCLEPLLTDADLAFHAFDDLFKTTSAMDGHIRHTTETLVAQAKLIQSVNQKLDRRNRAS